MKYCIKCGSEMDDAAKFCNACGTPAGGHAQQDTPEQQPAKASDEFVTPDQLRLTPGMAALCSFLLVGLGQIINGQTVKGIVMLVGVMIVAPILAVFTLGLFMLCYPLIWAASAYDAYCCAKKMQEGKTIGKWSFF